MNPMHGPNRFKLGVFAVNADGGLTFTTAPERWRPDWDAIVEVAQVADRAGLEFILPVARWKGYGQNDVRGESFETLTHAAALAALTERIAIFSTVHVPLVHPVFAAKALATVDHVSHGRAGINIVCGWNPDEFAMFGVEQVDDRYAKGQEWYDVLVGVLGGGPFDFHGCYYDLEGVVGAPSSVQQPRPVTMSAAFSPTGRDFAARTSDYLFTSYAKLELGKKHVEDIRARAERVGRELGVFTTTAVVCRASQAEAEEYWERYTVEYADVDAIDYHVGIKQAHSESYDPQVWRQRQLFAGGTGSYPLVGTPERIVEQMVAMHEIGFAGTTVSFVNFRDELPFFCERVLPLLERAGLRE
jgi:FMNH2-dependent dimethyl sulfone monooxygenase